MIDNKKNKEPSFREVFIPEELEDLLRLSFKDKLRIGRFCVVLILLIVNEDIFSLYSALMTIYLIYAGYGLTKTSIIKKIMVESEFNNKINMNMNTIDKETLRGLFEGSTLNDVQVVIAQSGSKVVYKELASVTNEKPQVTDEHITNAIRAINGKGKPLDGYQLWLGACCLLSWKYNYPRNLSECCERINSLPLEGIEYICKYENIRKFPAIHAFAKEDARNWDSYKPKEDERNFFNGCLFVSQALDAEIQKQIEMD